MRPTALVVDDEPDIRELLTITLGRMDIATRTCGDVESAKRLLESSTPDLCLTDMRLPDGDGLELVEWMQDEAPSTPVAVITAHGSVETAVRALKLGAFDFVSKPLDLNDLRKLVTAALKLKGGAGPKVGSAEKLIGESEAMAMLRRMIIKVARSQAPVHISGESGTGKELVARMIHESGPRADGPFVAINCGAIPTELMESEFFGHKKGSFTGAVSDKIGLVESAEGGTLFLDEVGELPMTQQAKLLRILQERQVDRIGSNRPVSMEARVIAVSNIDLKDAVEAGNFRKDLFYRINVIPIRIPPIRERKSDIPLLVEHFLSQAPTIRGQRPVQIAQEALNNCSRHSMASSPVLRI